MNRRRREGVAIMIALMAILVAGTLVLTSLSVTTQEHRIAVGLAAQTKAQAAAEFGLHRTTATWLAKRRDTLVRGAAATTVLADPELGGAEVTVRVVRLSTTTYLVSSSGSADTARRSATRTASLLVRLDMPNVAPLAALTTWGSARLNDRVRLHGADVDSVGPACPARDAPIAALAMRDTTGAIRNGCDDVSCLVGAPPLLQSPAVTASSPFGSSDSIWTTLSARASKTFASHTFAYVGPSATGGTCDTIALANWGNPVGPGPCARYLPTIHGTGDVAIAGGVGQGVLIVDGSLTIGGGFRFHGLILVRGALRAGTGGGSITGAAAAESVDLDGLEDPHQMTVSYSKCAVATALAARSPPRAVTERAWNSIY